MAFIYNPPYIACSISRLFSIYMSNIQSMTILTYSLTYCTMSTFMNIQGLSHGHDNASTNGFDICTNDKTKITNHFQHALGYELRRLFS